MAASSSLDLLRSVCSSLRKANTNNTSTNNGGVGSSSAAFSAAAAASPEWSDTWTALYQLCPEALAGAADILDNKSVTRVVARESRREFFVVEGSSRNKPHTCVPGFCTCMSYCQTVVHKPEALVCKHELAVLLADALGYALVRELDDAAWSSEYILKTSVPLMAYAPQTASSSADPPPQQQQNALAQHG